MDHDSLRLFLQLSRTLHFGRTSRECHLSPSTLSRTIQRIEEEVGAPLFIRNKSGASLTDEGLRFQPFANEQLEGWRRYQSERDAAGAGLRGSLTIFCSVTACHSILPGVLSRFREAHPEVRLRLETGYAANALEMLDEGAVDLTIAAIPERKRRDLSVKIIAHTPLRLVAPTSPCEVSRLVERDPIPWPELPFVLPEFGLARKSIDRWFRRMKIRPPIYGEVVGSDATLALVSLGCGVGVVPELVLERSPLRAQTRCLEPTEDLVPFRVGVCTHSAKLKETIVRAFWDELESDGV